MEKTRQKEKETPFETTGESHVQKYSGETQASPSEQRERPMERSPLWQEELEYSKERRALRFFSESDYARAAEFLEEELINERLSERPLGLEQQKIFIVPKDAVEILGNNGLKFETLPPELVEMVTILQMIGHETEVEKWIDRPLEWYGGKTSEEVIAEGRGQQLIHHLIALEQGNIGV